MKVERVSKVAYLVNQYPKVSHTFIRREIVALEALGFSVERISVRPTPDVLTDPADLDEQAKTRVLLDAGMAAIGAAAARTFATRPARFVKALRLALRMGHKSERGTLVHGIYLAEACLLREWLEETGCRHLHAHFGTNPATVAMLCQELGGPPFSFTVHGPEEFDKARLIGLMEKIRKAAFVVAISSFGRSQLFRLAQSDQWSKIHVIRCGIDDDFVRIQPAPATSVPRLVCVGRLCEQKGQLLLVEAAGRLARRGKDFELVLVGDGEMRAEVEAAITRHGIESRVRITGWLDGAAVREHILGARALILPSFAEGLPVVIMEALALARPVVSTFVAGIPELVDHEENGWLVPAGSVEDLVDVMTAALETPPEQLEQMGNAGRRRVLSQHDVRQSARMLATLLAQEGP